QLCQFIRSDGLQRGDSAPVQPARGASTTRIRAAAGSRLDEVRQPAEAGEAKQAGKAAQSRQAEQALASGDEAQAGQKAEESEKAIATVSRPANESPGER